MDSLPAGFASLTRKQLARVLAALSLLTAGACGDSGGQNGGSAGAAAVTAPAAGAAATPGAGLEAGVQPLFNQACNCHQSTPLMAPFSLKAGESYAALVNAASMQLPAMARVKPGALNDSYLWHKVNGTQAEACVAGMCGSGMIMPYTLPLRQDERDVIARWIVAGAPP